MKQPNPKDNPWRAVALTSAIGVDLAICIGAGYWLGEWLIKLWADKCGFWADFC